MFGRCNFCNLFGVGGNFNNRNRGCFCCCRFCRCLQRCLCGENRQFLRGEGEFLNGENDNCCC